MSGTEPRCLFRIWARNTAVIVALALVALVLVDTRIALIGAAVLVVMNTVSIIRTWMWLTGYRWFWWWR